MLKKGEGWIEVIAGEMFAGKTQELLRRVERVEYAQRKVQLFKPSVDDRYGRGKIKAHNGCVREAIAVPDASPILDLVDSDTEVVAIDEGQFFDGDLPRVCENLADRGVRVIVAGLDRDFRGDPFGPMPTLLALAEKVDKLHAICLQCGKTASRTQRLVEGRPASRKDKTVLIGGEETYEARCRKCHKVREEVKD